jgi:hypothetical protein
MQTAHEQEAPTPAIAAIAREIHERQAERARLKDRRGAAGKALNQRQAEHDDARRQFAGATDTAAAFVYSPGRSVTADDVAATVKRVEAARQAFLELRARETEIEIELDDLHMRSSQEHTAFAIRRALGGRTLDVPAVPNPAANDPKLTELAKLAGDVGAKLTTARASASAAADELTKAEARLAAVRVDAIRGTAKRSAVTEAEHAIAALRDTCDRLDQECRDLEAATGSIQDDRRAREDALTATWLPALRAEHKKRAQVFADALRAAVVASEALRPVSIALGAVANVAAAPWHEVAVTDPQSKFRRWIEAAIEAGEIK